MWCACLPYCFILFSIGFSIIMIVMTSLIMIIIVFSIIIRATNSQ